MEQLTTYRAKGKEIGLIFLFKYDLNGNLKLFEISEGNLNPAQMKWLFSPNFPANESIIKTIWMKDKKYTKVFEIEKSVADLSFEALWKLYDYKIKRVESEKAFKKIKEADIIRCFLTVKYYDLHIAKTKTGKAHLSTFINQRYFEDEWQKV